jgi:hypothetical protein
MPAKIFACDISLQICCNYVLSLWLRCLLLFFSCREFCYFSALIKPSHFDWYFNLELPYSPYFSIYKIINLRFIIPLILCTAGRRWIALGNIANRTSGFTFHLRSEYMSYKQRRSGQCASSLITPTQWKDYVHSHYLLSLYNPISCIEN